MMIITAMDCFYIAMILTIFVFIIHLEVNVSKLTSMMKEHTKFDMKMSEVGKQLTKIEKKL
jgi:hypothetical protein|tara:strand:- start:8451 stop:8633 length:183 start_codon:yes stop_codon:yes gene_type:complete